MKPCFVLCLFPACEQRHRQRRPWRCHRRISTPAKAVPAPAPAFAPTRAHTSPLHHPLMISCLRVRPRRPLVPCFSSLPLPRLKSRRINVTHPSRRLVGTCHPTLPTAAVKGHMDPNTHSLQIYLASRSSSAASGRSLSWLLQLIHISSSSTLTLLLPPEQIRQRQLTSSPYSTLCT